MIYILIIAVVILSVVIGRTLFRSLFNPIAIYAVIWGFELILYEWRLIRYYDLSVQTWLIIASAYVCFLLGILCVFAGRQLNRENHDVVDDFAKPLNGVFEQKWIFDLLIYIPAFIGLAGAIQHWLVLLNMFDSFLNILLNAPVIYMLRVRGEIHGFIPYLTTFSYVAIFLSGVYTGKKKKWHPGTLFAFLGIVLEDMAHVGRTGMLFAFFEFFTALILSRMSPFRRRHRVIDKKLIFHLLGLIVVLMVLANLVKSARIVTEEFKSASRSLSRLDRTSVISPSIYLYFSSQMGVLNKYMEQQNEDAQWGENTFLPIYNLIAKTGIIKKPRFYQKGYFVPMWSNTGTYLKELHIDYGYIGIFWGPFLLGLGITFFWFRYFQYQKLSDLVLLVYLFLILHFSFLMMISRLGIWWISFLLLLLVVRLMEYTSFTKGSNFVQSNS